MTRIRVRLAWAAAECAVWLWRLVEALDPQPVVIPPTLEAGVCRTCGRPMPWKVGVTHD